MKAKEFDSVVERRIAKIKNTLASKGKEYASSKDRLHNFKRAAEIQRTTPELALIGMLTKHLVSVIDMVNDDKNVYTRDYSDEKIGDAINYLILLEGLLREKEDIATI